MELLLKDKAKAQQLSVEELALGILGHALENDELFPTPEEVVAKIQATPPDPRNIRPASGSLAEALQTASTDPKFDLAEWNSAWASVEAEMKMITRANTIAEGRK